MQLSKLYLLALCGIPGSVYALEINKAAPKEVHITAESIARHDRAYLKYLRCVGDATPLLKEKAAAVELGSILLSVAGDRETIQSWNETWHQDARETMALLRRCEKEYNRRLQRILKNQEKATEKKAAEAVQAEAPQNDTN